MTKPVTVLWEADRFDLSQDAVTDTLVLAAHGEYDVVFDFNTATALRDAIDGWLMRHAYMA